MEQLSGAVCDLASEVVSALTGGDHRSVATGAGRTDGQDAVGVAAVRVLGADVLLPSTLLRQRPQEPDLRLFREAVRAFPPGEGSSVVTVWSHWAMEQALSQVERLDQSAGPARTAGGRAAEPDASWLERTDWQELTHQLAVLAALAVPTTRSAVAETAAGRPVDLSRGFVRAVRRRDWLQAAGAGRWLALGGGAPQTLGLDSGLDFVGHMGGGDPRVALHVQAARFLRSRAPARAEAVK